MDDQDTSSPVHVSDTLCVIILAAGFSSRMKSPKALLQINNCTFLEHIVRMYRTAGIRNIKLITGHYRNQILPIAASLSVTEVYNPRYPEGMYSSIQCGMRSCDDSITGIFIHPVDIPLVRPETIMFLQKGFSDSGDRIRIPIYLGKKGHPPLVSHTFRDDIIQNKSPGGLRSFFKLHEEDIDLIQVSDPGIHASINTPEEYDQLICQYGNNSW